jgi:hypothetical protein
METDAIAVLTADQDALKKLFAAYDRLGESDATDLERAVLAGQICRKAITYIRLEQEVFYPAVWSAVENNELLDMAYANHDDAKNLVEKIEEVAPDDDDYDARVALLGSSMQQLFERDRQEIFPRVARNIDERAIGERLQQRRGEIESSLAVADALAEDYEDLR